MSGCSIWKPASPHGGEFARGKAVHYRMHPDNVGCLTAIRPDVCALANNHILDFGYQGLTDTLRTLDDVGIQQRRCGIRCESAERPAVVGRVVIASCGMGSSGIPHGWAATGRRPGVAYVPDLSDRSASTVAERVLGVERRWRRRGRVRALGFELGVRRRQRADPASRTG